ncbi:MAG: CoA ester lyase [Actinomycetia bacterium]|nr:CoA ester lyase [Actinomycetes bacterium]MCP4227841.1 CoA ester lyase [Actinomycetes bacterium]
MTRIRRCSHFVPGANEKMLNKALTTRADALVLDLEDAVTPDRKDEARTIVSGWLRDVDFGRQERMVRVNALDTPWLRADLEATMVNPPDSYLIPKIHNGDEVRLIDRMISGLEEQHGHEPGGVRLIALGTETPQGFQNIAGIPCVNRVDALTWGAEDLSAAIGALRNRGPDGRYLPLFEHARTACLLSATAAGVQPLDTVFPDVTDVEGLRQDCLDGAWIGYTGKISIHPNQIDVINEIFTPSAEDTARAQALLDQLETEQAAGRMAFRFEGQMVDVPHFTQARRILALAEALEGLD